MERDRGDLVDNKFRMSDKYAAGSDKASRRLGCIDQDIPSRDQQVIISLCSAFAWPGTLCSGLVPAIQERCRLAGQSPKRSHKDEQRRGNIYIWGKRENLACSALKKGGLGETFLPSSI